MIFYTDKYKLPEFVDCEGMIEERLVTTFFERKPETLGPVNLYIKLKDQYKEVFTVDDYANDKVEVVNDVAFYVRGNATLAEWNGSTLRVYNNEATEIVKGLYWSHSDMFESKFRPVLFPNGFRPVCCGGFLNQYPLILDTQTGDVNYDVEKYVKKFLAARKPNDRYFEVIQKYISKVPENLHHKITKKAVLFALAS